MCALLATVLARSSVFVSAQRGVSGNGDPDSNSDPCNQAVRARGIANGLHERCEGNGGGGGVARGDFKCGWDSPTFAVGVPFEDQDGINAVGGVHVCYGSATGLTSAADLFRWARRTIDNAWSQGHASTLVDLNSDGRLDVVTGTRFMAHNGSDPGEREPLALYLVRVSNGARGRGAAAGPAPAVPAALSMTVEWIRHVIEYGGGRQIAVTDIDGDRDLDIVSGGKSGVFLLENQKSTGR